MNGTVWLSIESVSDALYIKCLIGFILPEKEISFIKVSIK